MVCTQTSVKTFLAHISNWISRVRQPECRAGFVLAHWTNLGRVSHLNQKELCVLRSELLPDSSLSFFSIAYLAFAGFLHLAPQPRVLRSKREYLNSSLLRHMPG
jgi:hypothetical protein